MAFAVLASLGITSWSYAQCTNDCGSGDTPEGEPCAMDLYVDAVNGGCNSTPNVFGSVSDGETICGIVSTFDADSDGDGIPDTDSRDTDWYLVSAAELAAADLDGNGVVQVTSSVRAEFDAVTFIIGLGNPACSAVAVIATGFGPNGCGIGEDAKTTIELADHPNGVVVFCSSGNADGSAIFQGFECSTGLNDYTLSVTLPDSPAACVPGAGPCNEPHEGAGCDDVDCCKIVCEVEPDCCDELLGWDQICADTAIAEGCTPPPVECAADTNTELTRSNSQSIVPFNSVACSPDGGLTTTENAFARSYNLVELLGAGQGLDVNCVAWGIETNSQMVETTGSVNVYLDNEGPGSTPVNNGPGQGLTLLGTTSIVIPADAQETVLTIEYNPPISVPADSQMVVELDLPDTSGITGIWPGSNADGNAGAPPTNGNYIRSASCGLTLYGDLAAIGFPNMHMVNVVLGTSGGTPCPWDCEATPDGNVGINDLIAMLGEWGGPGDCDFDDGTVGITDLIKLLGQWGPCPP